MNHPAEKGVFSTQKLTIYVTDSASIYTIPDSKIFNSFGKNTIFGYCRV